MADRFFTKWIDQKSRVLVLGCGSGKLQQELIQTRQASCFGLDISEKKVLASISKGLSVIQGDINKDLNDYPPASFDYVLADDILQLTFEPKRVIKTILTIGKKAIISFPNFGYIKIRLSILFLGRMPKTKILPYDWFETPNIHLFTIKDFHAFCDLQNIQILDQIYTACQGKKNISLAPNIFSEFAYFLLKK